MQSYFSVMTQRAATWAQRNRQSKALKKQVWKDVMGDLFVMWAFTPLESQIFWGKLLCSFWFVLYLPQTHHPLSQGHSEISHQETAVREMEGK